MLLKSSAASFRGIGGACVLRAKQRCCPSLLDAFSECAGLGSEIRVSVATDADFVRSRLSRLFLYALIATSFLWAVRIRLPSADVELVPVVRPPGPDTAICGRRPAGP